MSEDQREFIFRCSEFNAELLLSYLKRNNYLISFDEEFAKLYLTKSLDEFLEAGRTDSSNLPASKSAATR